MPKHGKLNAIKSQLDMEAAGLNRILALGSPASNVGQADVGFSNAGDSAVAGATAAQNITESQTRKTLNAANEQAAISSARAADEKAKLDAEVARRTREMLPGELSRQKNENTLGGLEVSKQKVLKGLYDKLGPMADKLMSKISGIITNASEATPSQIVEQLGDALYGSGDSWKLPNNVETNDPVGYIIDSIMESLGLKKPMSERVKNRDDHLRDEARKKDKQL